MVKTKEIEKAIRSQRSIQQNKKWERAQGGVNPHIDE